MICPNCGYLVTKRQPECPKCNNPLPQDEGEWSEESSRETTAPPERDGKKASPARAKPAGKEKAQRKPSESAPPAEPKRPESKEEPSVEAGQRPGPLFAGGQKTPESAPDKRPGRQPPPSDKTFAPSPRKQAGAGYTSPSPYGKESATFSSELGTDWIEKYARAHVQPLPERAGIGVRFWAGALDWIILLAVAAVILLAGRLVVFLVNDTPYTSVQILRVLSWPVLGVWLVLIVMYFTLFISSTGQTPGYYVMDIRAMDNSFKRPPGMTKAFTRTMVYLIGLALLGAGCWSAWFNEEKATWQDRMADVRVVPILRV